MKHLLIITLLSLSYFTFAAVHGTAKIKGVITSYDKNTVTLSQNGKKVKVHKKSIPPHFKIKGGNEVYALVSAKEVIEKIKKAIEKENKQKNLKSNKKEKK